MEDETLLLFDMASICNRLLAIRDRISLAVLEADGDHVWMISYGILALGGAAARIERADRGYLARTVSSTIPWSDVIGTRNILAHGYDIVDPLTLWRFLERDIPDMSQALETALQATRKDTPSP
ncbi:MAG: HepT-like ribonuclease domain-containing protein [Pseudomonadota bacterium]